MNSDVGYDAFFADLKTLTVFKGNQKYILRGHLRPRILGKNPLHMSITYMLMDQNKRQVL